VYDFKKLLAGVAAIGALGFGGSAIAGAQSSPTKAPPAAEQSAEQPGSEAAEAPGSEAPDAAGESGDEAETPVAPAHAKRASEAALAKVGSGKVAEVSAETPDKGGKADAPEKGDTPDPAYEQSIAYDVEVTKADGSVTDVHLDKAFNLLGTEAADQGESGEQAGEQDEAADTAEAPATK